MKAIGIVRRVDNLGRVCLPKELCNTLHIRPGDPVEFYVDGEQIIINKYDTIGDLDRLLAGTEAGIRQADTLAPGVLQELLEKISEMKYILAGQNF